MNRFKNIVHRLQKMQQIYHFNPSSLTSGAAERQGGSWNNAQDLATPGE